jgi:uncharacterized membrane protein SirB2
MSYLAVKHLHVTFVALSGIFFLVRGVLMLADAPALQRRFFRIAPHIVDTLLLASALVMVVWSAQYPFVQSWLTAKVIALDVFIALGTIALKPGKSKGLRTGAFIAALAVFAYIIKVAVTRQVF